MDAVLMFLKPVLEFLAMKSDVIAKIGVYGMAIAIVWGLVIEIFELVCAFTSSKADDELAAKIAKYRLSVLKFLEIFPHSNIPVAEGILKAIAFLKKALKIGKAAADAAKEE